MRRLARNSLAAFFVAVVMGGAPPSSSRSSHTVADGHPVVTAVARVAPSELCAVGSGRLRCGRAVTSSAAHRHGVDAPVSYTHLRAHETGRNLVCRLLLEKKKK